MNKDRPLPRNSRVFSLLVLASLVALPSLGCDAPEPRTTLERLGVSIPEIDRFVVDSHVVAAGSKDAHAFILHRDGATLRMSISDAMEPASAVAAIREQERMLEGVFSDAVPPYPEYLTNMTVCPDSFKPKKMSSRAGGYFLLYAGERFTYGACSPDLIRWRSGIAMFHCAAARRVFKVEYFVPQTPPGDGARERVAKFFESIDCRGDRK